MIDNCRFSVSFDVFHQGSAITCVFGTYIQRTDRRRIQCRPRVSSTIQTVTDSRPHRRRRLSLKLVLDCTAKAASRPDFRRRLAHGSSLAHQCWHQGGIIRMLCSMYAKMVFSNR